MRRFFARGSREVRQLSDFNPPHGLGGRQFSCSPQYPCNRHKACEYCARQRQRRIADVAEAGNNSDFLSWACIDSVDAKGKARLLRKLDTRGGMWTVEQGNVAGKLHLNVLAEGIHDAAEVAEGFAVPGVNVWAQTVPARDVRNVAAYISKKSQYPAERAYSGRTYGAFGEWRGVGKLLEDGAMVRHAPIVAGAAMEMRMRGLIKTTVEPSETAVVVGREPTREEAREIAQRHLPGLFEVLGMRRKR